MSYRSFWTRRFIGAGAGLPGVTLPLFKHAPFVKTHYIGYQMELIPGVMEAGVSPAPTITTEILRPDGTVLASNYVIQSGDVLRFRQTATNTAGTIVAYSGWVYAQQKITGYTDLTPIVRSTGVALTSNDQPGSRLHYISTSGGYDPALADYYFWTGSAIVDSSGSLTGAGGIAYGADWRNPTGPIKPYRHMSACIPTNGGDQPGVRTGSAELGSFSYKAPETARPRYHKPDRWLFARGDTFNTDTDLPDYQTFCPTFTPSGGFKLGTPGGETPTSLRVFCDYGPTNQPRPRIIQPKNRGGTVITANTKHAILSGLQWNTRIVGLHFDGQTRDADFSGSLNVLSVSNFYNLELKNNGLEDCRIDGLGIGDPVGGYSRAYMYRCTITDCWTTIRNDGHIAGAHSGVTDPGIFQMFDCRIARNGYRVINPALVEAGVYTPPAYNASTTYTHNDVVLYNNEWYVVGKNLPPAGTLPSNIAYWSPATSDGGKRAYGNVFDRNLYLAGRADMTDSVVLRGASGEQWRAGGLILNNFIQSGQVVISDWQLPSENENQTCMMYGNVIQNVVQTGLHTSNPLMVQLGCHFSLFAYNLCTFAQEGTAGTGLYMASRAESYDKNNTVITNRTRGNVIRNNLLHAGSGYTSRLVDGIWAGLVDGVYTSNPDTGFAIFPSLTGNRVDDNSFISTVSLTPLYTNLPAGAPLAPATTDTVFTGNNLFATRAAYASANSGANSERTFKTYLQSLGLTINSMDGVHEAVAIFNTMDRNNWPSQYSAAAINNYIRQGLGFVVPA
jgi:hypothetical protein